MWAPVLFDIWNAPDGSETLTSFAVITTEPPPEVLEQGHDRCPVFLREEYIEAWLNPNGRSKDEIYGMLKEVEPAYYDYAFAA